MRPWQRASLLTIALGIGLVVLAGGCGREQPIRSDLVLVSIDALRADVLDCYGGRADLGAEVCALGDEGARYVWAFSAASAGGPAAASLLTSLYPSRHGVMDSAAHFLPNRAESVTEALRGAGYATAAFVASPELNRSRNLQQGFDVYDDGLAVAGREAAEGVGDRAIAWSNDARSPWFAWIHFAEPHGEVGREDGRETSDESYETAIRRLDRRLSQLIAVLDARPNPPGILLIGLHGRIAGPAGGQTHHGRGVSLAEIRVPLLWRPPRKGAAPMVGRRIITPVSALDVAPTLLEAAAVKPLAAAEGRPLPLSDPVEADEPSRAIFAEHPLEVAVIVGADYAAVPRTASSTHALTSYRTARLWPAADPTSEGLPRADPPSTSAARLSRLRPTLEHFLAGTRHTH